MKRAFQSRWASLSLLGALVPCFLIALKLTAEPVRHFYYVDDDAAWESLAKNIPAIHLLSPAWVNLQTTGEVRVNIDARVKQLAVQNNIPIMPVVMNEDFKTEAARTAFDETKQPAIIDALLKLTIAEDFEGLQIDFENLEPEDREPYARFIEKLAAALHQHRKTLSVAVVSNLFAPSPEEWKPTPRSAAFDYGRLGRAADFLTLMTYDQYTSPDAPGPVAGFAWMDACVRKVLESVPPSKVSLGVPLYHRHWAGKQVTTGTWMDAQQISWKAKTGSTFDALHQEPVIRFRENTTDHVIWYHNAASVQRRIELAKRYRLRGFSAWRIGQEDPSVWTEGLNASAGGLRP